MTISVLAFENRTAVRSVRFDFGFNLSVNQNPSDYKTNLGKPNQHLCEKTDPRVPQ